MRVRELMTGPVASVGSATSVTDARACLAKASIRHLIVPEGGNLVGVITDRDIRLNLPSMASSLSVYEANYLLDSSPSERP